MCIDINRPIMLRLFLASDSGKEPVAFYGVYWAVVDGPVHSDPNPDGYWHNTASC